MEVVIVDDSLEERNNIYQLIFNYFNHIDVLDPNFITDRFYTDYDLYFLDIEMNPSGKEIAKKLNDVHPQAIIIFMTNHDSYIFETQILNPFYFIRKTHLKDDFMIAIEMLKNSTNNYLTITSDREQIIINVNNIKYIDIYRGKLTFHTVEKDIYSWGTLQDLLNKLPSEIFIKIHSSYIVNRNYITGIVKNDILIDDLKLPVSRRYLKNIREILG